MSVWEETWEAEREVLVHDDGQRTPADWWLVKTPRGYVSDCASEDAAKLVAAAPAMARLLRALYAEHGDRRTFDWAYWHSEIEAELTRAAVPLPGVAEEEK